MHINVYPYPRFYGLRRSVRESEKERKRERCWYRADSFFAFLISIYCIRYVTLHTSFSSLLSSISLILTATWVTLVRLDNPSGTISENLVMKHHSGRICMYTSVIACACKLYACITCMWNIVQNLIGYPFSTADLADLIFSLHEHRIAKQLQFTDNW